MPEVYPGLAPEHECQTCGARYYGEEAASGCPCNPDGQPATVADGGVVISPAADGTHNGQPVATDGGEQVTDGDAQNIASSEPVFQVHYECTNCGNKFSERYPENTRVTQLGSLSPKADGVAVHCPNCKLATGTRITDREPIQDGDGDE